MKKGRFGFSYHAMHGPHTQNEMKKKHLVSVAALAALFCLPCALQTAFLEPTVVLASTDPSADQFIDQYCGSYIVAADGSRQFVWYSQANSANASLLLESFALFGQLAPSTQQTIVATCLANHMDYYGVVGQAQALVAQSTPQQPILEQGASALEPEVESPEVDLSQNNASSSQSFSQTDLPSAPIAEVPSPSSQENLTNNSSEKKDAEATSGVVSDSQETPLPAPIATTQEPTLENQEPVSSPEPTLEPSQGQISEGAVENKELGNVAQEENQVSLPLNATDTQSLEAAQSSNQTTSQLTSQANPVNQSGLTGNGTTSQDGQATQFLNRYCYQNGALIRQATQANYRQLLNAVNDWLSLSEGSKQAVNGFLTSMGSQTFQTLYTQANRIRLGLPISQVPAGSQSSVNTAAAQDPSIWISGLWLSGQGMLYLTNERRLKVRIKKVKA